MAEKKWEKLAAYAVAVMAAGLTYYVAQTAINSHRATLPVKAYLDCIHKVSAFDWDSFPGEKPSSSDVCKDLTSREKA